MSSVSPGVFSKIIDLSTYVAAVPSTIGFVPFLSKQGRDNQLLFLGGTSDLISEFGQPNIQEYGKNYGQGPYIAYNFLGQSGALYGLRCMSDDAAYSNIIINAELSDTDSTASVIVSYGDSLSTKSDIKTALVSPDATTFPLCLIYPVGRGEYYNTVSLKFSKYANPMLSDVYFLDVYEKQKDGTESIVESFQVSFDANAVDSSGDSIFIYYILNNYSNILRCEITLTDGEYTTGYDLLAKIYDKNIGNVTVVETAAAASITDDKQSFSAWQTLSGNATYMIEAKDSRGNVLTGWLGTISSEDTIKVYNGRDLGTASQSWVGSLSAFSSDGDITYRVKKSLTSIDSAFMSTNPVPLKLGSDGALLNDDGTLNTTEATNILARAYAGTLINPQTGADEDLVLDTENIYFSAVFDAGYPTNVKTGISTLVQTRRDCIAILDNGDNSSFNLAITARENTHTFNNYYVSLYEEFNKVYDSFTGNDIWVSPVYHMAYILPRNDNVSELWFAAAGFNRAAIDTIEELRFNPNLGQRDQMYLKQLNPIVKFSQGYTVWGQLTSQAKSSSLSNLNVVRLVLYIKRAFETFCRFYIFEQNDSFTWNSVSSQMIGFLEQIKIRRGLDSYSVNVYATDYMKKTKSFTCDIMLKATPTTEQINLNFYIQ